MNNKKQRDKDLPFVGAHVCAICGDEFPVTRGQGRKIYCDACKPKHMKEWRKNHRVYKKYTCALCGQEFEHKNGGKPKYCLACLVEHRCEYPYAKYLRQRAVYEGGDI